MMNVSLCGVLCLAKFGLWGPFDCPSQGDELVRRHTLVNGLSKAGAGAESGYRANNLCLGYGPHLTHRPPIFKTYKALQPTPLSVGSTDNAPYGAAELGR